MVRSKGQWLSKSDKLSFVKHTMVSAEDRAQSDNKWVQTRFNKLATLLLLEPHILQRLLQVTTGGLRPSERET